MDTEAVAVAVAPPLAHLGSLLLRQSLQRAAHLAEEHPTKLLLALAWASVNVVFIVMLRSRSESEQQPPLILSYTALVLFYTALYLRRLLREHAVLRRGLGYAAAGLAAFLSALFFYCSFARGIPPPLAVGAWLLLAVPAAYCFYRVIVLHLDDDEETAVVEMQVQVRPPV